MSNSSPKDRHASGRASKTYIGTKALQNPDDEIWIGDEEPERDENDLYIGTYSNFFTDPAQVKGMVAFCGVLIAFFGGGQILSGLLLPYLLGGPRASHLAVSSLEYWTKF